ncbi:MAG: RES family NAD+ phosphorylase, partial [Fibrobacterota bacterium]
MLIAYRVVKIKRKDDAFSGEGARRAGGRWSSKGVQAVYAASTLSLAVLEILMHLEDA